MSERHEELLNVYDDEGRVVAAQQRRAAKASGRAVGAINVLLVTGRGEVLLQRRPGDKENGARWDKSVGGHVGAGEEFDQTALREASEELFDEPASPAVVLAASRAELLERAQALDLTRHVIFHRASQQRSLRDVRDAPGGGGVRIVTYHLAIYLGRTEVPLERFRPQAAEIDALRYASAPEIDALLLAGELAPNMAFLWLTHAHALLTLVPPLR
jgi:ADP-ribose pyrophosphatase YjhB (NUDIX family)